MYAAAVFAVLSLTAVLSWRASVDSSVRALRDRMLDAVAAIAVGVDPAAPAEVLHARFGAIGGVDPEIRSIYLLLTTSEPGILTFGADWSADPADQAATGSRYDARSLPVMLQGLQAPAVEARPYQDEWGWSISSYAPVKSADGAVVGLVGVDVGDEELAAIRREALVRTVAMYGIAALLVGFAAVVVARSVRDPLGRTIRATTAIASGHLETRLALERSDEFGLLGRHFDQMARGLEDRERIRGTFGRYVSEEVAEQLLSQPGGLALGGQEVECTILFSDLRGYSTISEDIPPAELVALLNEYLAGMQEVIDRHQGTVIEFLGDAILAVFGAPVARPGHAEAAVACALGMRARMAELNQRWDASGVSSTWRTAGLGELGHRVGIHTGRVVAGNLGSATRMKFAVIGDAVNVAARLEQLNKELGTDILLSAETAAALSEALRARCVARGPIEVKGRHRPVDVFSVST